MNKKLIILINRRFIQILAFALVFYFIAKLGISSPSYTPTQWIQWVQWLILLAALLITGISLTHVNRHQHIVTNLAQSEAKFRALSENSLMGVMMQEYTGKVTYANQSAAKIFGFDSPEDLLQADTTPRFADRMQYRTAFQKLLSPDGILKEEFDIVTREGEKRHVLYSAHHDKDAIVSTLMDITDRIHTQEENQQLSRIVSQMADSVAITDKQGAIEYVNPAFEQLTGYSRAEVIGKTLRVLKSNNHPLEFYESLWSTILRGEVFRAEIVNRKKNGDLYQEIKTITPIRNADGTITHFVATGKDITERKKVEEALFESEERFRALFESSHVIMMIIEPESGKIVEVNPMAEMFYGYTYEQLTAMNIADINQLPPAQIAMERQKATSERRNYFIFPHQVANGQVRTVEVRSHPIKLKEQTLLFSIIYDITEREKVEEELNESKQLFHLLLESLPQNIYAKDADGRFIFANQHYFKTQGKKLEEIVGKTDFELHPFELAEKYRKDDLQVMQTGKALEVEEEHQPLGEDKFFVQVIKTPFYDSKGQTTGTLGIFWDITERKQTEELLRKQSEQLRLLYEASQRLNRTLNLNDIYQAICDFTSNVIPNDSMVISKFDHETKLITCQAFWIDNEWLDVSSFPPIPLEEEGQGTQSIVIRSGHSMLVNDYQAALNSARNTYTVDGSTNEISEGNEEHDDVMRSALIVPLKNGDVVNGVIQVMSCNLNAYTENQLKLFEALALHIASAEKNALLYAQVQAELKERKQIEEFLRQLNEEYRLISENTGDTIWILDIETQKFTYVSPSVEKLLGYSVQEMMRQSLSNLLTEESFSRVMSVIPDRLIQFNEDHKAITYTDEFNQIRKDNSIVSIEVSTTFIVNGMGRLQVTGISRDITERKQAEYERQQSEVQFRALFDLSPDAVMLIDPHDVKVSWPIIDCNEAACLMNGYQREELIGRSIDIINIHPATPIERTLYLKQLKEVGNLKLESFHRRKNGEIFPIEVSTTLIKIGDRELLIGIDRDITERKQGEEALRQSNETARAILNAATESVFLLDINGIVHATNETTAKRLGVKASDLIGKCMYDFIPPDLGESRKKKIDIVFREHKQIKFEDFRLGAWIENSIYPIFDANGHVTRVAVYGTDITQRKQTEDVLATSERRYRALIENIGDGIELVDENGDVVYASPSATRVLGYSREDLLGPVTEKIHPDDLANVMMNLGRVLSSQEMIGQMYRIRHQDGTWRWIEGSASNLMQDPAVGAVVVTFRDITERKQAAVLQETVYRIAEAAQEAESLQTLYAEIHRNISNVMYAENLYLALYDEDNDLLSFVYAVDENGPMEEEPIRPKKGLTAHVLRTGKSLLFLTDQPTRDLEVVGIPPKVWLGVPLIVHGKIMGVLAVQHYTDANAFTEREQHILEFVSSQVATTIDRKRTEDAVRLIEKRNSVLIENAPDGIALIDTYGRFKFGSPSAYRMFGYTEHDILGHQALKFLHPDDEPQMHSAFASLIKHPSEIFSMEYRFLHKDGTYRWVMGTYYNLINEPGVNAVVNNFRDITESKQARELLQSSQNNLEMAQSVAHLGSWAIDLQTGIESWSEEMFQLFQRDTKQGVPIQSQFMELIHPEDRQLLLDSYQRALETDERIKYEYRAILPNNNQRYFEANLQSVRDKQGRVGISGTVLDITEARQSENALRLSDERFRQLAENIQEVFWLYDMNEQSIIYISPAYEIIWGRTCQSLYEKPTDYLESILQEDQPIMSAASKKQAKGERTEVEYRVQRPDGSIRWVWDRGFPIFDETGKLVRTAGVATDITSTKATEAELQALNRDLEKRVEERTAEVRQSEETYRALFENANDAIFLIQVDGFFLRVNKRCAELLGYTLDELIGRRSFDFIVPTATDEAHDSLHRLLNGERIPMYERRFIKKDGTQIDTEINLSLVSQGAGQPKLIQSVVRDITERKRAEETLRENRDKLSAANAALEKASRLKDEFLASMSHELRTPLTGILGLSEALQLQTFGTLNEKQAKALKNVESSGRHLLDLINDILDLSKIEAGKLDLQFELCSAADICQSSLQLTKGMANQKKQNIHFSMNPTSIYIHADSRRMKQMLVNLLSNAVKFTPDGGELGLQVEALEDRKAIFFSVWDKGIGIKPDEMEKLFKPFIQLDSSLARQYSGTGLGLSLVKRMAELHGGSVQVESIPAEGSRFTIILPWSEEITQPDKAATLVLSTENKIGIEQSDFAPIVMIADDSEIILEMITDFLEAQGWHVITTRSGLELLEHVAEVHPDIMLVDIQMPIMDGMATIRRLRAHPDPKIASAPIIALTALAMTGDREKCIQAGANEYLSKPVVLKQLVEQIKEILKKKRA